MPSLQRFWAHTGVLNSVLLPLAGLFSLVASLRRLAYRRGWLDAVAVGVPVVVVGNITAGGSGKTPLVIWLVNHLRAQGRRPGVVSRGYGGAARGCVDVGAASAPAVVGDEPLLIHLKTAAPVVVGRDRVAAARLLLARHPGIDVIVADDGLQHYRLRRTVELAVVDAAVGLGNGWPLPAGPLREPACRLHQVDGVVEVVRGTAVAPPIAGAWRVEYRAGEAYRLRAPADKRPLAALPARDWLAATGIGRPQGFFDMLAAQGLDCRTRAFADHHGFGPQDLPADGAVLMTEKDAVKCLSFAADDWWAIALAVSVPPAFGDWFDARIDNEKAPIKRA